VSAFSGITLNEKRRGGNQMYIGIGVGTLILVIVLIALLT
jgi:hypothetical protein